MFDPLEQSKISVLTVTEMAIDMLTVQHDMIFGVSFSKYPGYFVRQTSPDVLSCDEFPVYIWQSLDFGCHTPRVTPVSTQTSSDRLTANRGTVGNPCNLQPNAAGFILSRICKLAATESLLTWSRLCIPQDIPLHFVIIFLSYSTPATDGYPNHSARWERPQFKPIDGRFIPGATPRHTATTQRVVCPPRRY